MTDPTWWKEAIVYQIYPRSFQDSNGDGVGDLRGIIRRLDYIASLGVDVVWLNPVYPSPNDDNGYDVSDYRGIMPEFGTMADFDELLAGLHLRDIKLVMDLVVNHSSDEHRWFRESRKSRDNPYRNYYHWWPAERGTPPARFSYFDPTGGWTYDAVTDAYYLHYFGHKQPDLNWQNPRVREEVKEIMRFWLDKGIDGFRMDAFQFVGKDTSYPELPPTKAANAVAVYGLRPEVHDYLREINRDVMAHYDAFTVAEGAGSTMQDAIDLSDPAREELSMVYHFEIADYATREEGFDLVGLKRLFTKWDAGLAGKGWNSIYLGNHDVPRMVSKYGNDSPEFRAASATCLNTLLLTMRGTTYTYQGDEIGMTNVDWPTIEPYKDLQAINQHAAALEAGEDMDAHLRFLNRFSRDNGRTPVQWTGEDLAGFTTGTPWIGINPNGREINVARQDREPDSVLNHFRRLTRLRKAHPVLVYGDYEPLLPEDPRIFAYVRSLRGVSLLVVMNWSEEAVEIELPPGIDENNSGLLANNLPANHPTPGSRKLRLVGWQAVVLGGNAG